MKLYTYTIKNSLGQIVEPRYSSPHQDPDEAVREFLHAAGVRHPAVLASQAGWHAVPVLTGEIVKWRDGNVTHFAQVIDDVGTMVRVAFGDETRLVKVSEVTVVPVTLEWPPLRRDWQHFHQDEVPVNVPAEMPPNPVSHTVLFGNPTP